jgi:23S rRNA (cytidine1920-2'-O)/16S rRNA (cytidine1409-2'-O)-methyltransferase
VVRRGLAPSRQQARALILAGHVALRGIPYLKPGLVVPEGVDLQVDPGPPFVSRGGEKLAHGLDRFGIDPTGRITADVGASTGGFTDCLLQRGAVRVYAIDVGYGQLDWRLRTDERVVVMERTNARYLEMLPEAISLVVIDASFISLRMLLPAVRRFAAADADVVVLIKPQFEAGRGRVGKGGVVRDPVVHREVLNGFVEWATADGLRVRGLTASPLRGPAGNVEFLAWLQLGLGHSTVDAAAIEAVLGEAPNERRASTVVEQPEMHEEPSNDG